MRFRRIVFIGIAALIGCAGEDDSTPVAPEEDGGEDVKKEKCIDEDDDGYGENCRRSDCDDTDPEITDECYRCLDCEDCLTGDEPKDCDVCDGCECKEGTAAVPCTYTPPDPQPEGPRCYEGVRYCTDGEWQPCRKADDVFGGL